MPATRTYQIGIHIPKTGGMSLRRALERTELRDDMSRVYPEAPGIPESQFIEEFRAHHAGKKLIFGHVQFGLHQRLSIEARYFTVLREPRARAVSLYRHYVRNTQNRQHRRATDSGIPGVFRSHGDRAGQLTITCIFSGHHRRLELEGESRGGVSVGESLHRAKQHLASHFDYVGLTEDLERDRPGLERVLGVTLALGRENVDPDPVSWQSLSDSDRAAIDEYFAPDLDLYEFARQLRRERWVP